MDKRIGILTFHYADNHGAVLQTYALYTTINNFSDCHAEIINYVPEKYSYPVSGDSDLTKKKREKREKFAEFLSHHCGVNTPMIHSVDGNNYDLYLVGSDQVWNTDLYEVAADHEYFLPHLDDKAKRAAYSASVGMDFGKIDRCLFQKYLSRFQYISLREKSYIEVISELSGKECECTLDPSMLLDAINYEMLTENTEVICEPFILYFWYDFGDGGLESLETVNTIARKYGLSIKHTFWSKKSVSRQMLVNDGGCILQEGVREFLWYVKNAQIVVTNSFHGAVFSILLKKPLYIYYPKIRRCRQENLVNIFRLQERVIEGYIPPNEINFEMDYDVIFDILDREKERSISFLRKIIDAI